MAANVSEAARLLMVLGDADAEGVTATDLVEHLRGMDWQDLLRLRVGCASLVRIIDGLHRAPS